MESLSTPPSTATPTAQHDSSSTRRLPMRYRRLLLAPTLAVLTAFGALIQSGAGQQVQQQADCTNVISTSSIVIGSNCGESGRTVIGRPDARGTSLSPSSTRQRMRKRRGGR